jgi:hypothetical protein
MTVHLASIAIISKSNIPIYMKELFPHAAHRARQEDCDGGNLIEDERGLFGLPPPAHRAATPEDNASGPKDQPHMLKECSIRQQFILHEALDRFEQIAGPTGYGWRQQQVPTPNEGRSNETLDDDRILNDPMFVGLLYPIENYRVYGMCDDLSRPMI